MASGSEKPVKQAATSGDDGWQDYTPNSMPQLVYPPDGQPQAEQEKPGAVRRFGSGLTEGMGAPDQLSDYIEGPAQMVAHPVDSAKLLDQSYEDSEQNLVDKAYQYQHSPGLANKMKGLAYGVYSAIPFAGPALARAGEKFGEGDVAGGLGTTIGAAAPGLVAEALPKPLHVPTANPGEMATLGETPRLRRFSQTESARKLTQAINPRPEQWGNDESGFIRSARDETANVLDYAKRNKMPMQTQNDFANAARGAGREANAYYEQYVLGPVSGEEEVVPQNYGGRTSSEGRATLRDINNRVVKLNDAIRNGYEQRNDARGRAILVDKGDLVAEKNQLTDILNNSLAKRRGMDVNDVAALRQRIGKSFDLERDTDEAVNQRQSSESRTEEGRRGIGAQHVTTELFAKLRGGPEAIANRRFRRAIGNDASFRIASNVPGAAEAYSEHFVPRPSFGSTTEFPAVNPPGNEPAPFPRSPLSNSSRSAIRGESKPATMFTIDPVAEEADNAAVRGKLNRRANVNARAAEEKKKEADSVEAQKQYNRSQHGKYKTAEEYLKKLGASQ